MRHARTPHAACGAQRASNRPRNVAGFEGALARVNGFVRSSMKVVSTARVAGLAAMTLLTLAFSIAASNVAFAQVPVGKTKSSVPSAFPKPKDGIFGTKPELDRALPLYLQADQMIYNNSGDQVIARGNVEIYYNNNILTADEVVYDQSANTLSANGNVVLKEANGNVIRAERYTLTEDFRDGFVESLSVVARDQSQISAERAIRRDGNVTEFVNGKFTACPPSAGDPPPWCVKANRVVHDQAAQTITYQDATFEIFGAPVLYLPYFQHADPTVKRKSGFLIPEYKNSDHLGFAVSVPYYFALAPNYDVLVHPMYTSEQGILYRLDWRHRIGRNSQYSIKFAGIDQDGDDLPISDNNSTPAEIAAYRNSLDGWRGSIETRGIINLGSWWNLGWDVTIESDDTFRRFYQLDSILLTDRVNNIYLEGISDRNYMAVNLYHFGGLLLTDSQQSESQVHPVFDYNVVFNEPILGGELSWNTNALSMTRDDVNLAALPNNRFDQSYERVSTEVKWRRRMTDSIGISYTPFGELRGDVYKFDNYQDPLVPNQVVEDTFTRGLATGGLTVSYPWVAQSAGGSHVIEPIGQIVAHGTTDDDQQNLPNEDSRSLVFDDTNLFNSSKFSGWDRIETGVRANVGVQYTFQANNGGYARILAGQSFQLSGDNAYTNPALVDPGAAAGSQIHRFSRSSGLQDDASDYVLGVYLAPTSNFKVISQSRFDSDDFELRSEQLEARLAYGPISSSMRYSYTKFDPEIVQEQSQQEILGRLGLQLTDRWGVYGSLRYDIDDDELLQSSLQLRYGDECFALSATYTRSGIDDPARDLEPDDTILFRFELKHLGAYQYKTDILDHNDTDQQTP